MSSGVFIAVEGIDGAGVTTQASILQQKLEETIPLVRQDPTLKRTPHTKLTKEPTDGPAGGQIRMALAGRLEVDPETLALLFATDRKDHVENEIKPLIEKNYVVIADRYYLSSYAYQLDGVDGDLEWLQQINNKSLQPDLILLLDVDVETSKERRKKDRLTLELFEEDETLEKVRENYLKVVNLLKDSNENIEVIDASGGENEVADRVFEHVAPVLREKNVFPTLEDT